MAGTGSGSPGTLFIVSPIEGTKQEQVPISRLAWSNLTKRDTVSSLGEGAARFSEWGREQPEV